MNKEALFLFLIILFGLAACSFLGTNCHRETMTNMNNQSSNNNPIKNYNNDNDTNNNNSSNNNNYSNNNNSSNNNNYSNNNNNNSNNSSNGYDNYNHYTGSSASLQNGSTFYGGNGGKVVVRTNGSGEQTLSVTLGSGQKSITLTQQNNSSKEGYTSQSGNNQSGNNGSVTKFVGPNGVTAVIATNNGQQAIKVTTSQGTTVFTENGSAHKNSNTGQVTTSDYHPSNKTGGSPYNSNNGPVSTAVNNNYTHDYGSAGGPGIGAPGPGISPGISPGIGAPGPSPSPGISPGINPALSASALVPGIPAWQIPSGQEDLYILKSQVVPPVCPVCPVGGSCGRNEPCPACPACARCPEPSFECKKVPNYNSINEDYLPQPVLNDFSSFGS